tara:strand:+ start:143 stop:547 length:405 start_codon:yes stop_codon:yes gene_type:complete
MEDLFQNSGRNGNGQEPVDPRLANEKYDVSMKDVAEFLVDSMEPVVIRIERGIPIPNKSRGADPARPMHPIAQALDRMEVGDSICIPPSLVVKAKSLINTMRKRLSRKNAKGRKVFTTRLAKGTHKTCRVWRIQ